MMVQQVLFFFFSPNPHLLHLIRVSFFVPLVKVVMFLDVTDRFRGTKHRDDNMFIKR